MSKNSKPSVMFLVYSLAGGGAERMVSRLANAFVTRGFDTHIGLMDTRNIRYTLDETIQIADLSTQAGNKVKRALDHISLLKKYIKKNNIKVVYAFMISMVPFAILAKGTHVKVIGAERTNPKALKKIYKVIISFISPLCDGYVFQTYGAKECYPKAIQRKSIVIGNISPNVEELEVEKIPYSICVSGRLHTDKDYPTLLRALKEVILKVPEARLYVYGEGSQKSELIELSKKLGIERYIFWMGFSSDILKELPQYEVFAFSSKAEGMPNALIEAMTVGLPCVATNCEFGPSELIDDGKNGYLVEVGDYKKLGERITHLLLTDKLRKEFSIEAISKMKKYKEKEIVDKYENYTIEIGDTQNEQ